jgi:hypothetical protein
MVEIKNYVGVVLMIFFFGNVIFFEGCYYS